MAALSQNSPPCEWSDLLPTVHLDVRQSGARPARLTIDQIEFLIGAALGCDLRAGGDVQGVACLLSRHPGGVTLRRLAPTQSIIVDGQGVSQCELATGNHIRIGAVEIVVHVTPARMMPSEFAATPMDDRELEIARQTSELDKVRQEMASLRQQLYDHYQDRRDQLAAMHDDLEKAKRALDEREKKVRLLEDDAGDRRQRDRQRQEAVEREAAELNERTIRLEAKLRKLDDEESHRQLEWSRKHADLQERERALAEQTQTLDARIKRYEADVLRLTRIETNLEERESELKRQAEEITVRREELQKDTIELQQQLLQFEEWRVKYVDEAARLAEQKKTHDDLNRQLTDRGASLEGQQATFTILRGRLERMREELRVREQQLDEQSARQEAKEAELSLRQKEIETLEVAIKTDQLQYERDRQGWAERSAVMDAAVRQMKEAQRNLADREEHLHRDNEQLDGRRRQFEEAESILKGRLAQLGETQERLDAERASVRERGVHLAEREDACAALQEQLHRRAQEIDGRHKEITDRLQDLQARLAEVEASKTALEQREQLLQEELEARRRELDAKAMEVEQSRAEVTGYEGRHQDLLTDVAVQRRTLAEERAQFHLDQQTAAARLADARNELDALRRDTLELVQQLPDAEVRAGAAVAQLADARSQLRDHLSEIHAYVRQCQDEMEQLRGKLQGDLDQLIGQEQNLRRSQDEHRLAVAAFKQQLIDWQGQITDLKRLLARDERHLEHKQARADERAKEIDQQSQKLAEHAEALQQQEVEVAERRDEIDRHLADMRQWYRHKLRELAGIPLMPDMVQRDTALAAQPTNDETGEDGIVPIGRSILSITAGADPSDQKLGELLRDAQLVDADTLTALLAEARRQRRSLRQVLLASGVVTLYQLALIETGNVQGLMLGPVRVLDRLRHTAHETAYRVFDPRRGAEAVLRHLSEAGMTDAIKPDEFRQRFAQAMLNDPRVANTLEVFDVGGRPAVLQEWLTGLSASDWPPLAAAPGVCYRLLTQAAQGLAVAHRAGLVHGHLSDAMMMLTAEGVLKIRGFGEPPWLIAGSQDDEPSVKGDLRTLGKIVSGWCTAPSVRKGAKTKPLPEAMVSILYRLAADGDTGYRDAQELIADLQNAANAIPANAEAWDRLLKYAREHAGAEVMLRQSA